MKKIVSLIMCVVICLSTIAMATSCSSTHPIDEFESKMDKADSYQIAMTMSDVPFVGTITITTKVDGNVEYTPETIFTEEEYIETVGDDEYRYAKDELGNWYKEKVEEAEDDSSSDIDEESMEKLFDSRNYDKVKGEENTYKQKSDVVFEEFEDVTITIKEDSYTIEMTMTSDGMTFGVKIVISKIDQIKLTLPEID